MITLVKLNGEFDLSLVTVVVYTADAFSYELTEGWIVDAVGPLVGAP